MLRSKYTMIRDTTGTYRDNVTTLTPASANPNVRWNVCNEIHAAHIHSTWRLAEAEFIIINRNNIKLFHFTISDIVFVLLIFHGFVWILPAVGQIAVTRQHLQDSALLSRW